MFLQYREGWAKASCLRLKLEEVGAMFVRIIAELIENFDDQSFSDDPRCVCDDVDIIFENVQVQWSLI